ncbi:MAG: glycosyltransferase [Proteobacteria bacterium]|nr:MAG: glycosyltransferase [Pseudomonadota bacterium]
MTRISVITAVHDAAGTIADCLDSLNAQTLSDWESVVIDGASTDGTLDVLRSREPQPAVLLSEPDRGIYDALNKGIARSTGDVIGFLHADDLFFDAHVLEHIAHAFSDATVDAVYGDLQYVRRNDTGRVIRYWRAGEFARRRLAWGWMPPHPTLYVRREWYERIGGFDTRYRIAADYFSILSLFAQPGFKAVYLPRVLVKMRAGGASNRSLANVVRKSREDYDALRRSGVGGLGALVWKNVGKLTQFLA